ncbi:MAG: hypothetical protein H0U22_00025 [Geodermatophilaceae bacterium]|nr:hypothetical protein [Geodermatophilaceae bacterium]
MNRRPSGPFVLGPLDGLMAALTDEPDEAHVTGPAGSGQRWTAAAARWLGDDG